MGNTQAIAARHYLQVTDEHYAAAQNAAQHPHVSVRKESQVKKADNKKTVVLPSLASECETVHKCTMGDEGLEPPTSTV